MAAYQVRAPDYGGAVRAERDDEPRHVLREDVYAIGIEAARLIGGAVPAQVGGNDAEACLRERRDLVSPRSPALGKTVQEQDKRTAALLRAMQGDAVPEIDAAVLHPRGTIARRPSPSNLERQISKPCADSPEPRPGRGLYRDD